MSDWTSVLTDVFRPYLRSYMLEFYWAFVRTEITHGSLFWGQSVRTGMVPQLGYARPARSSSRACVCTFTKDIIVTDRIFDALTTELKFFVDGESVGTVRELLVEAAAVVHIKWYPASSSVSI